LTGMWASVKKASQSGAEMTFGVGNEFLVNLAKAMLSAQYVIVITGAGVSTESGIPDFRGPKGLWRNEDVVRLLSLETLYGDPRLFYSKGLELLRDMRGKRPNPAHKAIAQLEKAGVVKAVITQNVDGLHQAAGSKRVLEIHGHLRTSSCDTCKARYPFEYLVDEFNAGNIPPRCIICNGVVRPDVVFFDDPMPQEFQEAVKEAQLSDFALVVGSSLMVAPAAYLPGMVPSLGIVNLEPTPYDEKAVAVIREKAGIVLPRLVRLIEHMSGEKPGSSYPSKGKED